MPSSELSFDPADDGYLSELAEWVAIPSVSRDADEATMRAAADWLASRLAFANARVEPTAGHPVVRGEWLGAPGAPTVLVYGHYDVQPTGSAAEWLSEPFELSPGTLPDGTPVVRGRGSSDDKGPVYVVLKTAQAFIASRRRAAAEREVPVRGRGGDRQPAPARLPGRARPANWPPTW